MEDFEEFLKDEKPQTNRFLPTLKFDAGASPSLSAEPSFFNGQEYEKKKHPIDFGTAKNPVSHTFIWDISRTGWGWVQYDPTYDFQSRSMHDLRAKRVAALARPEGSYYRGLSFNWLLEGFDFIDLAGPIYQMTKAGESKEGGENTWAKYVKGLVNQWIKETDADENKALKVSMQGFTRRTGKDPKRGWSEFNIVKQAWVDRPAAFDEASPPIEEEEIPFAAENSMPPADNDEVPF